MADHCRAVARRPRLSRRGRRLLVELALHTFFLIPGLLPGTHSAAPRSGNRGSAVGVAVFGAIVNATLGGSGVAGNRVAPEALTTAVHHVFLGTTMLAVAMLAAVLSLPSCVVPCACPIDVHFVETEPTVRDEGRSWPGGRAAPG